MQVIKRDSRRKEFIPERILTAAGKAFIEVYGKEDKGFNNLVLTRVLETLNQRGETIIPIEEIQDIIVDQIKLLDNKVALAYISYREERTFERDKKGELDKEIDNIINAVSEQTNSNGNLDGSKIQTIRALISNVVGSNYSQRHKIPKKYLKKHKKSIYIHDETYFGLPLFNCCLVDWISMFENGFDLGTTLIGTPNSIETAINVLSQVASHISSNTYGGTTFPTLITGLTPYAVKSLNKHRVVGKKWISDSLKIEEYAWDRLGKEIEDSMQSLEYEVQTLMTSRAETPFLTLGINNVDLNASEEDQKIQKMITEAILNQRIKGLTGGVTPVFPKLVYQNTKGNNLNPGDKYYDLFKLAVVCSAHRQYPDYINTDKAIEVTGDYKECMGCRSFLGSYLDETGNYKTAGRFNFGVISINLVRLAIQADRNEDLFFNSLHEALNDCKDLLMIRYDILKNVKAKQAPILYMSGAIAKLNAEDTIEPLLNNGYASASIGYVGLHNCLTALYGKGLNDITEETSKRATKIMKYLRDYCDEQKDKTKIGFSLYGSPAETLATKFCVEDVKDFGVIDGVNDNGYYENSFHYPSNELISPFDKLDLESESSSLSSGGAISFVELGDMTKNLVALEDIIRYSYDKTHFLGISSISDKCLKCGYTGEMFTKENSDTDFECPVCKNDDKMLLSIIRKLCGYLGSIFERPVVNGKMKEIKNRKNNKGCN
ncbi:anaerobic ribonucleoside-triphosphate reductase [Clostridium estertheticum]|uniref:anaerobic ribonucleoside-triphosphate reductase n=1 Tax=Clostridium estertheticum TaxID=238834 RepID=UPI001C7D6EC3|nr:anaerobic ribonucleoside-triphosphate reductase [Clostridium estertheticum]MBX4262592.1 anaerobic ribonucleoside-triphosphate reductase [Clostridium estertheticum]WLC70607.1 anaerobic ribonucleoside-triphosphate reductase [Clostridium estertheticum]